MLSPEEWRKLKLMKREKLTHNTDLFRFEIPNKGTAHLPIASCLTTRAVVGKKQDGTDDVVIRPYTPTSPKDAKGYMDLVVKMYSDGKMSQARTCTCMVMIILCAYSDALQIELCI